MKIISELIFISNVIKPDPSKRFFEIRSTTCISFKRLNIHIRLFIIFGEAANLVMLPTGREVQFNTV